MARRRKNESIFEMLMEAPWWLGVIGAAFFYVGVGKIAPSVMSNNPMGSLAGIIGNWFAVFCLFSAAVSAIRSLKIRPPSGGRRTMA